VLLVPLLYAPEVPRHQPGAAPAYLPIYDHPKEIVKASRSRFNLTPSKSQTNNPNPPAATQRVVAGRWLLWQLWGGMVLASHHVLGMIRPRRGMILAWFGLAFGSILDKQSPILHLAPSSFEELCRVQVVSKAPGERRAREREWQRDIRDRTVAVPAWALWAHLNRPPTIVHPPRFSPRGFALPFPPLHVMHTISTALFLALQRERCSATGRAFLQDEGMTE
jgi:hypothetical protein